MSDLLARAGAFFLAPPSTVAPERTAPAPTLAVVLAEPRDLAAACGGVAASLRRAAGARTVVVCTPTAPTAAIDRRFPPANHRGSAEGEASECRNPATGRLTSGQPATVAASRLARRLLARGIDAVGAGALCLVSLPDDTESATPLAWRAVAAVGDAPVVVGVSTRTPELDAFLAQADRLLLVTRPGADAAYLELALGSLARLGPPASAVEVPTGVVARRAAALGLVGLGLEPVLA